MTARALFALTLSSLAAAAAGAGPPPDAETLIAASIEYHDPEEVWTEGAFRLEIDESRPDGSVRASRVILDNGAGSFELFTERDGDSVEARVVGETCEARVNGSSEIDDATREKHRLSCERLQRVRNYYAYLWGMPMKLRDPGTRIDPKVEPTTFDDRPAWGVRVTYDEAVGGDVWYFYFDPETSALVGYRFYHDEDANDGEYIHLEGETSGAGLRLPAGRAWYMHQDDRYLGTDTLTAIQPGGSMSKYRLVTGGTAIPVPGGKTIDELFGRVNTGTDQFSLAHMVAPAGWTEPPQTPEFGELTLMIRGSLTVDVDGEPVAIEAGQALWVEPGATVHYRNTSGEEAEYYALCLPAFTPERANRHEQ